MSRRKVGGAIKKAKTPKICMDEKEDENVGDLVHAKKSVKTKPITKKGGKAAASQEQILLEIENENTTKHLKELCSKFEPPACKQCPNRNADRICVCEACGYQNYLSLICGKCHNSKHTEAKEKPELDVEEFFVKLGTFLKETKVDTSFSEEGIDVEKLQGALYKIAEFENKLEGIKETFRGEIATYKSPEEVEGALAGSLAKAMSEQMEQYSRQSNTLKKSSQHSKTTKFRAEKSNKSFFRWWERCYYYYYYYQVQLLQGTGYQKDAKLEPIISVNKDDEITIQTMQKSSSQQVHLDFEINPKKNYTLKFTAKVSSSAIFCIGLMKKQEVFTQQMNLGSCGLLFKRFAHRSHTQDCSKVLKGIIFGDEFRPGDSFEMRFCIEDQILEFSTLPGHKNIVSKLDYAFFDTSPEVKYVISLFTFKNLLFTFNSLKETFSLPSHC